MTRLTLFIDADRYPTARALHEALKLLLDLPAHYGCNADALYDCLSERVSPVNLCILSEGTGETADALKKVIRVVEELDGNVTRR